MCVCIKAWSRRTVISPHLPATVKSLLEYIAPCKNRDLGQTLVVTVTKTHCLTLFTRMGEPSITAHIKQHFNISGLVGECTSLITNTRIETNEDMQIETQPR